jgi:UPF0755 protein
MQNPTRIILTILVVSFLSVALVACVVGGGLYLWARQEGLNPITAIRLKISLTRHEDQIQSPAGTDDTYREFEVFTGDSAATIAQNLAGRDLISDADLFMDYVRYHGLDSRLRSGTFYLRQTQTIEEIAYALTDASNTTIPLRLLPGWRLEEVVEEAISQNPRLNFSGADFWAVVGPGAVLPTEFQTRVGIPATLSNGLPPSLEGFMYPADYRLRPDITAPELRDEILAAFDRAVTPEMYTQAAAMGLSMYEVVTLASIVQREAAVADEAPVIASVYLNRLNLPMRLDADPTVQYAIGSSRDGRWWPNITLDDYYGLSGVPNQSYSTYLNEGLPPGPICSPGLAAINAVLNAPETEYFYFRLGCEGDGRHEFFTLEQQADHANFTCP